MPSRFFVYSLEEKDRFCQNIYVNYILDTYQIIKSFESSARLLDSNLPVGCYTNFRDALFHFRKMVRSSEGTELEKQAFAIQEHCGRAQSDAATSVLSGCTIIIKSMLKNPNYKINNRNELDELYNRLKSIILTKRIGGMMIDEFGVTGIFACSMEDIMNDLELLFHSIDINANEAFHKEIEKLREDYQKNETLINNKS